MILLNINDSQLTRSSINWKCKEHAPFLLIFSSGTGRTAVFIAMDALYNQGLADGMINVPEFVSAMGLDRRDMIENLVGRQLTLKHW